MTLPYHAQVFGDAAFQKTALLVWILALAVFGLLARNQILEVIPSGNPVRDKLVAPRSDFGAFYTAGVLVRESPNHLYDERSQETVQSRVLGYPVSNSRLNFIAFPYPALVALIFVPFTFLEFRTAYFGMVFVNSVLLAICLGTLAARFRLHRDQYALLAIGAGTSVATYALLLQGQLSAFTLLLILLIVLNLDAGRVYRAGLWIGLLSLKPVLLPVWIFWLVFRREWRALACAVCTGGAIALLSVAIVGIQGVQDYLALSQNYVNAHYQVNDATKMPNLRGIVQFFGLSGGVWLVAVAGVISSLAPLARTGRTSRWTYCALVLAMVLVAPHYWYHDLNVEFLVVAIAMSQSEKLMTPIGRWATLAAMFLPWFLTSETMKPALALGILACFACFLYVAVRHPEPAT